MAVYVSAPKESQAAILPARTSIAAAATAVAATTATAALSYLHALFDYLRLRGVTDEAVLQGRALDFSQREARITEYAAAVLFNHAAQLIGYDALGLHGGVTIPPGLYDVPTLVASPSTHIGSAQQCQGR